MSNSKILITSLLAVACVLRLASPQFALISFVILGVYSLAGPKQVILSMFFVWLFVMLNPGIAPEGGHVTAGKYFVFILSALSVLARSSFLQGLSVRDSLKINKKILFIIVISLIVAVHSVVLSPYKLLSFLKISLWALVFSSLVAAWFQLSVKSREKTLRDIFYLLLLISFLSAAFIGLPVGYLANGSGFQGVLNQPQVFGVTLAISSVWVFSKILMNKKNFLWWAIFIFLLSLVFLSEARTAGVAIVLALSFSLFIYLSKNAMRFKISFPGVSSISSLFVILGGFLILSLSFPMVSSQFDEYMTKGGRDGRVGGVAEGYEASRGFLIARMFSNIIERPFFGIGFGVASIPNDMEIKRDPILGIPLSAPVEKGVLPLAVIEELGVFLGFFVLAMLGVVLYHSFKIGFEPFSLVLVFYLLNMGEAMLFSPGGMGLLVLILFSGAVAGWGRRRGNVEGF